MTLVTLALTWALTTGVGPAVAAPDSDQTVSAAADSSTLVPQRDLFDVVHDLFKGPRVKPEYNLKPRAGLSWVALPSISYNPLYGVALGASANAAGPLGDPETTRISVLSLSGNYSTTGQIQALARGDLYLWSNDLLVRFDTRYLDTSRPTWGLGPMEGGQREYTMEYQSARTFLTVYKAVGGSVYAGIGVHRDDYFNIVDKSAEAGESTPYTEYSGGPVEKSGSTGLSFNLMNDERDNPVNCRSGYYLSASFRAYTLDSGGTWQEMLADFRSYPIIPKGSRHRLAFWVQTWFTFGKTPYLSLPHLGGDTYNRSGRGYVLGRVRSQNLVTAEVEYRFDLRKDGLLGAVAFLNITSVTDPETGVFGASNPGGGAGLRIKFNKRSDTNLVIDAGWGEYGSFAMFLGTTEAF